jgi:glutaminyl-peptide cyclotransferase
MVLSAIQTTILAFTAFMSACSAGNAMGGGSSFDEARAWKDLEHLVSLGTRTPGSAALETTRAYLEQELTKAGLVPVREPFEVQPPEASGKPREPAKIAMANVYADLKSKDPKAETVILCTHFDTKIGPMPILGANDGGSGTAVLLELARVLAAAGPRELTYRFLFLDGEEAIRWDWAGTDNTYGSRHHAGELRKSGRAASVRCCLLLDMVGDKDLRFLNESLSNRRLAAIVSEAAASAGLSAHVDGRRAEARDDHLSFMAVGIPSLDLIDFDYGPDNAWWHTKEDTLDKCSPKSLGITGRIVLASLPLIERGFARE